MTRDQQEAQEFATRIKAMGFRVFLSKGTYRPGTWGFITDEKGSRILSFSIDGPWSSLSGNYGPPSTESGTGWKMDEQPWDLRRADQVSKVLNAYPPPFAGKGWKYLSTLEQYDASIYEEVI